MSMDPNPYSTPLSQLQPDRTELSDVSEALLQTFAKTKGWMMFLGILMFLGAAQQLFSGLFSTIGAVAGIETGADGVPAGVLVAINLFGFAVNFVLGLLMVRHSLSLGNATQFREEAQVEAALETQRILWKWFGITWILNIVFLIGGLGLLLIFSPEILSQ